MSASRLLRNCHDLSLHCARLLTRSLRNASVILATLSVISSPVVHAANQGNLGNTSSAGSVDIDLVLGLRTRISGFNDIPLGVWSGSGSLTGDDNLCIGQSGASFAVGNYRVRASGDGEPGDPAAFTLSNGAQTLKYNAWFNDAANAGPARQPLVPGVTLTGQASFGLFQLFNASCNFLNANISVEVPESELQGGTGTYSGTLTLLLLPE